MNKIYSIFFTLVAAIIVKTKSFRSIVTYVTDNLDKFLFTENSPKFNYFILPVQYSGIFWLIFHIEAFKSINFYDIMKAFLIKHLLTEADIKLLFLIVSNQYDTKIIINKGNLYLKNKLKLFFMIFDSTNYIQLLFTLLSKSMVYVDSKKLTHRQNELMRWTFYGKSRPEIVDLLKLYKGTLCSMYSRIFIKLKVNCIEDALICLLKDTKKYKHPNSVLLDRFKFKINVD
jgi:DNA-binding CsgD family transcriptional regulator